MAISSKGNTKEMQGVKTWDLRIGDRVRVTDKDDILEVIEVKDTGFSLESQVTMKDGRPLHWNDRMFECCGRTGKIVDVDCVSGSFGKILVMDDEPNGGDGDLNGWVWCSQLLRKIQ